MRILVFHMQDGVQEVSQGLNVKVPGGKKVFIPFIPSTLILSLKGTGSVAWGPCLCSEQSCAEALVGLEQAESSGLLGTRSPNGECPVTLSGSKDLNVGTEISQSALPPVLS